MIPPMVLVLAPVLGGLLAMAASAQEISVDRLSDDILILHETEWEDVNMVVVATDEGLVVLDTFSSPAEARDAKERIAGFSDLPIRYVVNTHDHWDHLFGNQEFPEATILGHQLCVEDLASDTRRTYESLADQITKMEKYLAMKRDLDEETAASVRREIGRMQNMQRTFDSEDFRLTPPSLGMSGGEILYLGGKNFHLRYFGPLHTDNDLVVFVPEDSLLLTGDIFYENYLPVIDRGIGATLSGWITMLETLVQYGDRVRLIPPGHGSRLYTMDDLRERLSYLVNLREAIRLARENGLSLDETKARIHMEKYEKFPGAKRTTEINIEAAW